MKPSYSTWKTFLMVCLAGALLTGLADRANADPILTSYSMSFDYSSFDDYMCIQCGLPFGFSIGAPSEIGCHHYNCGEYFGVGEASISLNDGTTFVAEGPATGFWYDSVGGGACGIDGGINVGDDFASWNLSITVTQVNGRPATGTADLSGFSDPVCGPATGFPDGIVLGWNNTDSGDLSFQMTPVPEPATLALVGTGLIGFWFRRWKR